MSFASYLSMKPCSSETVSCPLVFEGFGIGNLRMRPYWPSDRCFFKEPDAF